MKIFAVFAICYNEKGEVLVTSRPSENRIGLIGGKVDEGEDIFQALERETLEEGAMIKVSNDIVRIAEVEGKLVAWIKAEFKEFLNDYKEKYRGIVPSFDSPKNLSKGLGNDFLI